MLWSAQTEVVRGRVAECQGDGSGVEEDALSNGQRVQKEADSHGGGLEGMKEVEAPGNGPGISAALANGPEMLQEEDSLGDSPRPGEARHSSRIVSSGQDRRTFCCFSGPLCMYTQIGVIVASC